MEDAGRRPPAHATIYCHSQWRLQPSSAARPGDSAARAAVVLGGAQQRHGHVLQAAQDQPDVLIQLQARLHILIVSQL